MSIRTRARRARLLTAAAGLAAAALVAASPATGVTSAAPSPQNGPSAQHADQGYTPGGRDDAQNAALRQQLAKALSDKGQSRSSRAAATSTIYYDASNAPSFAYEISQSASIWNSSVNNVRLVAGSPGDLTYYEGNDPRGSYYSGNGHGSGYILLDYSQANQYDPLRIVAHETGHNMGLPDDYSGPCSELMSGGGPGRSCTNPYPDRTESSQVNALWANGFVPRMQTSAAFHH